MFIQTKPCKFYFIYMLSCEQRFPSVYCAQSIYLLCDFHSLLRDQDGSHPHTHALTPTEPTSIQEKSRLNFHKAFCSSTTRYIHTYIPLSAHKYMHMYTHTYIHKQHQQRRWRRRRLLPGCQE